MKIISIGINPNCSSLIVQMHSPWELKAIQDELKELMRKVPDIELGLCAYLSSERMYANLRGENLTPDDISLKKAKTDDPGKLVSSIFPNGSVPKGIKVQDLERIVSGFSIVLYEKEQESNGVHLYQYENNTTLSISDYDHSSFSLIAKAIRAMGYSWYSNGGSTGGFEKWCSLNGFEDVVTKRW